MTSDAAQDRFPIAAAAGAVTLAWYAMPDVVRSRGLRTVLKLGLLGGSFAAHRAWAPADLEGLAELRHSVSDDAYAIGIGALALGSVLAVIGEQKIYRLGERRRARGRVLAHTGPALVLAGLAAASGLIDPDSEDLPADL